MKKLSILLLATFALAGCALDQSIDDTTTGVQTLTSDFGDVIVVGEQLSSGDLFAEAFLPGDMAVPVASYSYSASTAIATWDNGEMSGVWDGMPEPQSLDAANYMAYQVWASSSGVELGSSPYGCSTYPCRVCNNAGCGWGVCMKCTFGVIGVEE